MMRLFQMDPLMKVDVTFKSSSELKMFNSLSSTLKIFGMRLFIFPVKVMKRIQRVCRNFLWGSTAEYTRTPVSWEDVCRLRKAGGLGFKNLVYWNYACNLNLIWDIANKKDILWVRWIHNRFLKNDTFWSLQPKANTCYYLRKMLSNRRYFLGMNPDEKYDTYRGYNWLMGECREVQVYHIVWSKLSLPKHQFLMWLNCRNRLLTKVRLSKFMETDVGCVLCCVADEDKNHLFFSCNYTKSIQQSIFNWRNYQWKARNDTEV